MTTTQIWLKIFSNDIKIALSRNEKFRNSLFAQNEFFLKHLEIHHLL